MKTRHHPIHKISLLAFLLPQLAHAQLTWDANGTTTGQTDGETTKGRVFSCRPFSQTNDARLYRRLDLLHAHKERLCRHLHSAKKCPLTVLKP